MDVRVSFLVVAMYVLVGVAVVAGISYGISFIGRESTSVAGLSTTGTGSPRLGPARRVNSDDRAAATSESHAHTLQRIEELERLLAEQRQLAAQRQAELKRKEAQYEALETELQSYLDMLAVIAASEQEAEADNREAVSNRVTRLQADIRQLRGQLDRSETEQQTMQSEVARLREALAEAYDDLAEREVAQLLDNDGLVGAAATQTLVIVGAPAVEPLSELLADEQAEVRLFSATALGRIGPPAAAAGPALRELLADPDPRVRQAVRLALDAIRD